MSRDIVRSDFSLMSTGPKAETMFTLSRRRTLLAAVALGVSLVPLTASADDFVNILTGGTSVGPQAQEDRVFEPTRRRTR
jgi:hypothetical protein